MDGSRLRDPAGVSSAVLRDISSFYDESEDVSTVLLDQERSLLHDNIYPNIY
jgi:hypothetical protein